MARLVGGKLHEVAEPELRVARGGLAAAARPLLELLEEQAQERGLELVEARVVADELEVDLVARAVEGEHVHPLAELVVVDRDEPAVAEAEEVLRRVEAERRRDARPDPRRAERLRGILDHRQAELRELAERHRAAEEVDGHDRLRPVGDACGDVVGVEVERRRVDVREHRRRAAPGDRLRGRIERERGADHLVAGADLEGVEDEHERVGAVRDPDRPLHAEVGGRLLLERRDVRPADERSRGEHLLEPRPQLLDQWRVLRLDVNERDLHDEKGYWSADGAPADTPRRSRSLPRPRSPRSGSARGRSPSGCRRRSRSPRRRRTRSSSR